MVLRQTGLPESVRVDKARRLDFEQVLLAGLDGQDAFSRKNEEGGADLFLDLAAIECEILL